MNVASPRHVLGFALTYSLSYSIDNALLFPTLDVMPNFLIFRALHFPSQFGRPTKENGIRINVVSEEHMRDNDIIGW
jgi:hypothetical protein